MLPGFLKHIWNTGASLEFSLPGDGGNYGDSFVDHAFFGVEMRGKAHAWPARNADHLLGCEGLVHGLVIEAVDAEGENPPRRAGLSGLCRVIPAMAPRPSCSHCTRSAIRAATVGMPTSSNNDRLASSAIAPSMFGLPHSKRLALLAGSQVVRL